MIFHNRPAAEFYAAVRGFIYAGNAVERSGLARAVGADQGDDFAFVDFHGKIVYGDHAAELHGNIAQTKHIIAHFAAPFPAFAGLFFLRNRSGSSRMPIMP